jgi:hypothetical protein
VSVENGAFIKSGQSTIYGDTDLTHTAGSAENTSASGEGHAVYTGSGRNRYSTAGPGVNLDSGKDGEAGGWEAGEAPSGFSLEQSLTWLDRNAVAGGEYTVTLHTNETIAPQTLYYGGKAVKITLQGDTSERTVGLTTTARGSLFTVGSWATLTLGAHVTLRGHSNNDSPLVTVNSSGTLTMNAGSKITGNTAYEGGGVYASNGGAFTMNGGEISGNSATYIYDYGGGGGVYIESTFTMNGGKISGNSTNGEGGGGVLINGTFAMNGGEISGNSANGTYGSGGGVYSRHNFTMTGGAIHGNTASRSGGGVYVRAGSFSKTGGGTGGGVIYGSDGGASLKNTVADGDTNGHAVYYEVSVVGNSDYYYRDATLTAGDNISTGDTVPAASGETVGKWTKR